MNQEPAATSPPADFPACLNRVLRSENVPFQTFVIMQTIDRAGGTVTKARLTITTGASFQIVNHNINRTPFFESDDSGPLVAVSLNEDGRRKLDRINAKLASNY